MTDPATSFGRTNVSLRGFAEALREAGSDHAAAALESGIPDLEAQVAEIRNQRNRILAHSDLSDKLALLRQEGLPEVSLTAIAEIVGVISSSFNKVEKLLESGETYFSATREHAYPDNILTRLKKAREAYDAERP